MQVLDRWTLLPLLLSLSSSLLMRQTGDVPAHLQAMLGDVPRSIRRDVPMTDMIRRGFAAGTRDATGRPGPAYWQLRTDFDIGVRLERETFTLFGRETITIHNTSPGELAQLHLRLDHNLFRERAQRGASRPAELTEGMVVTRMALDGDEIELTGAPRGRRGRLERSFARGLDRTVAAVWLREPIASGAVARLEIEWHTRLPGGEDGSGHRMTQRWGDRLFQPTQWFPRLCKYDDLHGWYTDPYLGPAEFYNNFGTFDVRIDVPTGWIVTCTGVLQNPEEVLTETVRQRLGTVLDSDEEVFVVGPDEKGSGTATAGGERLVWRFHADLVNDFAWATAEDFVWRATRATIPGRGPIPVHMVYLPERERLFRRAGAIARHAIEYYSELWVPYPFPQLTLQDGPSAGMEYPMVINSNQGAADHEVAHQWWPMMLGTNETWYGWMDEGLNQFMNIYSGADSRGREADLDGRGSSYGRVSGNETEPPMMWIANDAGAMYGFQTYQKAPLMLSMLGGIVGDEKMLSAIREYARVWAFKHPSPWDFVFFLSDELQTDLGWFFYYWLWTTEAVHGSIENVVRDGGDAIVTVRQRGQMPSPVVLRCELVPGGPAIAAGPGVEVVDADTVLFTWPVDVWFDGSRTFAARCALGGRVVEKITLDPRGRFPDSDLTDNVWPR